MRLATLSMVRLAIAVMACCLALIETAGADNDSRAISFDMDSGLMRVPVNLFSSWRWFILDTGCDYTVLHPTFTNHLVQVSTAQLHTLDGLTAPLPFFQGVQIFIGHWAEPDYVASTDLQPLEELIGATIDGVLGVDVLAKYALKIDFTARTVDYLTNLPAPMRVGIPFRRATTNHFTLPATLANGPQIELGIDTGFVGEIQLNALDWQKAFPDGARDSTEYQFADFQGKITDTIEAILPSIQIGSVTYTNLLCSRLTNTNLPSLLGLVFLRQHQVLIDYPDEIVQLRRIGQYKSKGHSNLGFALKWVRGSAIVLHVEKDGAADDAGLKVGDEITRVNGKMMWDLPSGLHDISRPSGTQNVTMTILRQGNPITKEIRPKQSNTD
jgi:hypothetical protein